MPARRYGRIAEILQPIAGMVLQVVADIRRVLDNRNAVQRKSIRRTDAREHQQLRCLDRAGGKDDLPPGRDADLPAADESFDARRPPPVDDDPQRSGAGADVEILPRCCGLEIGRRRTHAPPAACIDVIEGEPLPRVGVEIVEDREPVLRRRPEKRFADRQAGPGAPDPHGACPAMPRPVAALVRFRAPEIGKQVLERPAGAAHLAPDVVFTGMAPRVDHAVDAARTAQHPSLEPGEFAVLHPGNRVGLEAPVEPGMVRSGEPEAGKAQEQAVVAPARLEQHDRNVRVLRKPCGDHGARCAGPDD